LIKNKCDAIIARCRLLWSACTEVVTETRVLECCLCSVDGAPVSLT